MSASDVQPHATPPLLRAVSLRYEARSAKTMWVPRMRDVQLELALDKLTVLAVDTSKREPIPWLDVLGAHILNENGEHLTMPIDLATVSKTQTYVFALFAFPAKHAKPGKLKKRQLREWLFRFPGSEMEDLVTLTTWVNYLADPRSFEAVKSATKLEDLVPVQRPNRKFLVVINPVGGAGKGVSLFENKVAPLLKYANIDVEVQLTERAAHGVDIAQELTLGVFDCLVTVGGDGSLCEIFQGLMKRSDWKDAIRQPLGVIPGGSGNGLFASLMHDVGEHCKPSSAGFVLAKGLSCPLDLTAVRNPESGESVYSFLSTEWAFIADADIESEKLRAIGGARFTVTILQKLLLSRKEYAGQVWYLDEATGHATQPVPHHADDGSARPGFELFSNIADGTEAPDGSKATWKKVEGGFHLVWVMNVTHASSDGHIAPGAQLNDGYNYLVLLDASYPRMDLINLFLAIENGTHIERDCVRFIKTRAFKIVPSRPDDVICVDGELFRGPLEAQVHHNVARIVTLPRESSVPVEPQ